MDASSQHGVGRSWLRTPSHHDKEEDDDESEEGDGGGSDEDAGAGREQADVVDLGPVGQGGADTGPAPPADPFEAERQRLRTDERSFIGRPHGADAQEADDTIIDRHQQSRFLMLDHEAYHHHSHASYLGGGLAMMEQSPHPPLQPFFAPYPTTQPSHHLLLHQSHPPLHHHPHLSMAAFHHRGGLSESLDSALLRHHQSPDAYSAAQFPSPEHEGAGEESPDAMESTRQFLLRLAHKNGNDEGEVMPFILKLEREWLIQKEQLKCLDEETFVARLGFPASLAQLIREELSAGSSQIPNMIKYKVDQRQQSQHPQHHQPQQERLGHQPPQPTQAPQAQQPPENEGVGEPGNGSSGTTKDGSPGGPGRKRKRLTLAEWVSKVEQFSLGTNHDPSPFRVASIYQVECYCCGYAVNMNKPGQLYYLKRHVEGVRPDVRISNHFKNYKRWRQQYHPGEPVDLTPDKLTPAKRQKAGDDNEDEVENDEGEDGQVLGYSKDEVAIRRIRSHSPSPGRRAEREASSAKKNAPKPHGTSGEGEIEVEGEGSIPLRSLDFIPPQRLTLPPHSGSPLHGVPLLPEHMMPPPFNATPPMQLHPITHHLGSSALPPVLQPHAAPLMQHVQFSPHQHYQLPPQPVFTAQLGHIQTYPSSPQSQQPFDQYTQQPSFAYGLPPQQHPQYPPISHMRAYPLHLQPSQFNAPESPGASQPNERHA